MKHCFISFSVASLALKAVFFIKTTYQEPSNKRLKLMQFSVSAIFGNKD